MILLFKSKTASRHFFSLSLPLLWITRTKIQTLTGRNQSFNPKDTTELSTEHPTLLRVSLPIPLFTASWEYHSKASDWWKFSSSQCINRLIEDCLPSVSWDPIRGTNKPVCCLLSALRTGSGLGAWDPRMRIPTHRYKCSHFWELYIHLSHLILKTWAQRGSGKEGVVLLGSRPHPSGHWPWQCERALVQPEGGSLATGPRNLNFHKVLKWVLNTVKSENHFPKHYTHHECQEGHQDASFLEKHETWTETLLFPKFHGTVSCTYACQVTSVVSDHCNPMYRSPGSSVYGILQAGILDRVAMPSSKAIFPTPGSNPYLVCVLRCQAGSLPLLPTWEAYIYIYKEGFLFFSPAQTWSRD